MFEVVKKAGISAAEFGTIVGVSRLAAHNWIKGHTSPHLMIAHKAKRALALLTLLVKSKKLPFPELDRDVRRSKILKLKEIVQNSNA